MNRQKFTGRYQNIGIAGVVWSLLGAIAPAIANAEVPLIRADVESLQNRVEVILQGGSARPATLSDWLGLGDALRTSNASRAELRFNDGSLARVGERATFRFVPDTRSFRLSNGTVLLLIPPGNGPSMIHTPSAVTGVQGTALVVRHIPFTESESAELADSPLATAQHTGEYPGRTIVMVLTNNPQGPAEVTTADGQTEALTAGYMAVIEGNTIEVLEFDLSLFYQTSPLVQGLGLDDTNFKGSGEPTDPVRQETLDGLAAQGEFAGDYLLNPQVLTADSQLAPTASWFVATAPETAGQGASAASGRNLMTSLLAESGLQSDPTRQTTLTSLLPAGLLASEDGDQTTAAPIGALRNGSMSNAKRPTGRGMGDNIDQGVVVPVAAAPTTPREAPTLPPAAGAESTPTTPSKPTPQNASPAPTPASPSDSTNQAANPSPPRTPSTHNSSAALSSPTTPATPSAAPQPEIPQAIGADAQADSVTPAATPRPPRATPTHNLTPTAPASTHGSGEQNPAPSVPSVAEPSPSPVVESVSEPAAEQMVDAVEPQPNPVSEEVPAPDPAPVSEPSAAPGHSPSAVTETLPEPVVEQPSTLPDPAIAPQPDIPEPAIDAPTVPEPVLEQPVTSPEPVLDPPQALPEPVIESPSVQPEPVLDVPSAIPEPAIDPVPSGNEQLPQDLAPSVPDAGVADPMPQDVTPVEPVVEPVDFVDPAVQPDLTQPEPSPTDLIDPTVEGDLPGSDLPVDDNLPGIDDDVLPNELPDAESVD